MQSSLIPSDFISWSRCCAVALAASIASAPGSAAAAEPKPAVRPAVKPATKPTAKSAAKSAPKVVEPPPLVLPEADAVQLDAAERVYYGTYDCEFNQSITLHSSPKYLAYVDLTHGKASYLMKPVLSSTGAIRLEDVRGLTLMVQISNKSMLLDVKAGKRLVDECVSPKQRELIEAARQAKAAAALEASQEAARSAAAAASVPMN